MSETGVQQDEMVPPTSAGWSHGEVAAGAVRLHYVEAGQGEPSCCAASPSSGTPGGTRSPPWVQNDVPDRVNDLLIRFFTERA